jgi:hypothetical protein
MSSRSVVRVLSSGVAVALVAQLALWGGAPAAAPAAVVPAAAIVAGSVSGPTVLSGYKLTSDETWGPEGSPYVLSGQTTVPAGVSLTLLPGTVVKFDGQASRLLVWGQLLSLGLPDHRVVITSVKEDAVGGDSNGDGDASSPGRGDWGNLDFRLQNSSSPQLGSVIDYTDVRYGDYGSATAVSVVADVVVTGACEAVTAGVGSIGCVVAGGFVGGAVYGALKCPPDNNQGQCILENGTTGAAFSFAGGIAGKAITKAAGWVAETKAAQTLIKGTDDTPAGPTLRRILGLTDEGSSAGATAETRAAHTSTEAADDVGAEVAGKTGTPAANTGTRLRPGLTQPGVARTLENSLNPDAYIDDVVSHYGINLRGSGQSISVQFNPNLASAGRVRAASPNLIEVGPNAFASSEEMARTGAHELNHARSFLRGGAAPESTAYGAEGYLSEWMAGLR